MFFTVHIRQRIATFFVVFMLLIQLNNVLFRHAHRLANGKIISHAHPYKPVGNSPFQPNNHSTNELYLLDTICNAIFVGLTAFTFKSLIFCFINDLVFFYQTLFVTTFFATPSLRGPPIFC
ncbi:hypothetical protein P1X15_26815 [Runella sp. MFBS21]|uniref:hypothetical protein n=1 Tax=Runella sp. MFBS21 TaxID=3034018 RepID=UPI0023F93507|nr:hypothetical protein [Runella sp. MFBS21]MCA0233141.1 hypothetical protein [Bacteroidota bacterium]MDF7821264.1 hypothetical protein [Runella sp. MFBS21]